MRISAWMVVLGTLVLLGREASAQDAFVPGGGSKRKDCRVELGVVGGSVTSRTSVTCVDGSGCDADGVANGVCQLVARVCIDVPDSACPPATMKSVRVKAVKNHDGGVRQQVAALQTAATAIPMPASAFACSTQVQIPVALGQKKGVTRPGHVKLALNGKPGDGDDKVQLDCTPGAVGSVSTTTTLSPGSTTTTTTVPPGTPGAGLRAEITGASVSETGTVTATFTLTDTFGVAVTPVGGATSNPNEARVRMTIAHLDVDTASSGASETTFTRYRNYITTHVTSPITQATADQPTYDSGGTFALVDAATGVWTYTFKTTLPAGFDATETHSVGAQIERTVGDVRSVANPVFDFVPAGGAVTTVRELTTTAQCNSCHDVLQAHGGGRREYHLCQLCHTDQAPDPDTGNSIELMQLVHRLHMGKDLPSVADGAIGAKYSIIGFQQSETVFAEKVPACATLSMDTNAFEGLRCEMNADCGPSNTCTGSTTVGVGFPQDIRNCGNTCHAAGATSADWYQKPSVGACASCHDDVNPGLTATQAGPAGTNHVVGQGFSEAVCRDCHAPTPTREFDITIPGAHLVPARSTTLAGLRAQITSAVGAPGGTITVGFRLTDAGGAPITSLAGINRIGFAANGPSTDFTDVSSTTNSLLAITASGSGSSGVLTGPDGDGNLSYTTAGTLPGGAAGTWRIGIEVRKPTTIDLPDPETDLSVNQAAPNDVFDFSVDGSPVTPRRQVVSTEKCMACHGTFSVDFSVHGNLRNNVDYCVVCHAPNVTDFATRNPVVASGAPTADQALHLKVMIHKIHRGEHLEQLPYVIYGRNSSPADLGEVLFPGILNDCDTCHVNGSQLLPLPTGVAPTRVSTAGGMSEQVGTPDQPVAATCLSCHDGDAARAHALTNTAGTAEACEVCHGEGSVQAVSVVHATGG